MTAACVRVTPAFVLALACLGLHLLANGRYGIFRDELYFIICGNRPDWGYVDQPALVPLFASWAHALFGDFLLGFRLLPALVMTACVALTADFTRLIGGGRFAQWLAGLCVLLGPIFLLDGVLFITDMFQPLTWLGLAWILVRLEQTGDERWWLAFGALAGFSLNTKYLVAFYIAALAIGLLATPQRKSLRRPYVYLGALIAGALIAPNILWQQAQGWPFLELGQAAAGGKNLALSVPEFFVQQVLLIGPLSAAVWLCGLWAGIVRPPFAVMRALPVAWLILLLVFTLSHGKPYYLAAIYPALLALGAVRVETWITGGAGRRVALAVIALAGAGAAPFTLPIFSVDAFIAYAGALNFTPSTGEHQKLAQLPQYYADMFGWREMAERVAAVYWALPPQDRARAVFYGNNYGEAAAIDVFGPRLGLPPAIGGHNQYYLWGPRGHDGEVVIIVGGDTKHYADLFGSFQVAGHIAAAHAMPYETGKPIYVLRDMKMPLMDYWPQVKSYR